MLKEIHAITKTSKGPEFNICADEANSDWLRARRLSQDKSKKAADELEQMENTVMYRDEK